MERKFSLSRERRGRWAQPTAGALCSWHSPALAGASKFSGVHKPPALGDSESDMPRLGVGGNPTPHRPVGSQVSAAKDPEGRGPDAPSPFNVKRKLRPTQKVWEGLEPQLAPFSDASHHLPGARSPLDTP